MSPVATEILEQLKEIEKILLSLGLYTHEAPSKNAFNSVMPFCCDQMHFHEWLQWVFIPCTRYSLAMGRMVPFRGPVTVMAETEMAGLPQHTDTLLSAIYKLDELLRQL